MEDLVKPTKEYIDKLREPVLVATEKELERLEDLLGIELICGVREEHPDKLCVSRLALATAMFNDAQRGMRLCMVVEDDGSCSGFGLIDVADKYGEDSLKRNEQILANRKKPFELFETLVQNQVSLIAK